MSQLPDVSDEQGTSPESLTSRAGQWMPENLRRAADPLRTDRCQRATTRMARPLSRSARRRDKQTYGCVSCPRTNDGPTERSGQGTSCRACSPTWQSHVSTQALPTRMMTRSPSCPREAAGQPCSHPLVLPPGAQIMIDMRFGLRMCTVSAAEDRASLRTLRRVAALVPANTVLTLARKLSPLSSSVLTNSLRRIPCSTRRRGVGPPDAPATTVDDARCPRAVGQLCP